MTTSDKRMALQVRLSTVETSLRNELARMRPVQSRVDDLQRQKADLEKEMAALDQPATAQ